MKTFFRKFVPVLLISVFLFSVFAPVFVNAEGQPVMPKPETNETGTLDCSIIWNFTGTIGNCIVLGIANVLSLLLRLVSWVLTMAAGIFNIILGVQNEAFQDQPLVNIGWIIARDVVNIFYIFILLIIAIATILRIESYGMKQILWKLIISALLVNFSLTIAGVIVDASNALGNQFYSAMGTDIDKDGNRDISTTLVSGFNPQKITQNTNNQSISGAFDTVINIIIAYIAGILLIMVATFVLLAGAFLLIGRIIAIWFLLLLSPFAFLFWVLPATQGMARQWFEKLFKQSFFYPAYMFILYLVFKAISEDAVMAMLTRSKGNPDDLATALEAGAFTPLAGTPELILGFVFLGGLLLGSLIVAQQMGAYGASAALKVAQNVRGKVQGAAGRTAWRTAGGVARGANAVLPTRISRAIGTPLRTAISKGYDAANERAKAEAKKASNKDPRTTARMMATMNAKTQKEVFNKLKDDQKGKVATELKQFMGPEGVGRISQSLEKQGVDKNEAAAFAAVGAGVHQAMKVAYGSSVDRKDPEYDQRMQDMMNAMSKEDRQQIYANEGATNEHVQNYFLKKEKSFDDFTKTRKDIDNTNTMLGSISKRMGTTDTKVIEEKIRVEYDNPQLAQQFAASPGVQVALKNKQGSLARTREQLDDSQNEQRRLTQERDILNAGLERETDIRERGRIESELQRVDKQLSSVSRNLGAQQESIERTEQKIEGIQNRKYPGAVILESPNEVPTSRGKDDDKLEKELNKLKGEIEGKADKES